MGGFSSGQCWVTRHLADISSADTHLILAARRHRTCVSLSMDPLLSRAVLYTFGFLLVGVHGTHYRMYGYPLHTSYIFPPMVHGSAVLPVPRPGILASPPHSANVRPKPETRTLQPSQPAGRSIPDPHSY